MKANLETWIYQKKLQEIGLPKLKLHYFCDNSKLIAHPITNVRIIKKIKNKKELQKKKIILQTGGFDHV